jgi:glucokinase
MNFREDKRIVMTLDAGGTNFVFSAIQGGDEIVEPITMPSNAHDLNLSLSTITEGFIQVRAHLSTTPDAISFAFPGPADYQRGIIGDLQNLPSFRDGVALGPMLEDKFELPVFINNDGDLYAYGEAIGGYLPWINGLLEEAGSQRRYRNLIGFTLGTGFGGGIVVNGELVIGDNSGAAEVCYLRNKLEKDMGVEESVSIRAVQRFYTELTGISFNEAPTPKDIYEIGIGKKEGNVQAAIEAYQIMAEVLGDAIANVLTLIDGIAVIGGGIAGAHSLFFDKMIQEMNNQYHSPDGEKFQRLFVKVFNLENKDELDTFIQGDSREIKVPGSDRSVFYDPMSRVGVGLSKMGTSKAIAIGAYAYALNNIS